MESYYHILFDNLPEDQFKEKRLGDLIQIVGGGTPSTIISEYWTELGKGISWVGNIDAITRGKSKFIYAGERDVTEEGLRKSSTKLVDEDSILFSCRGTVGKMGISDGKICFSRGFFGILTNSENVNYFWFLLQEHMREIKSMSKGTVMDGISTSVLKDLYISLPYQELIDQFNKFCETLFKLQKANEREIRELLKLQKYFVELTD